MPNRPGPGLLNYAVPVALLLASSALAQEPEHGIEASVFGSAFFGGDSGVQFGAGSAASRTRYSNTFDTGIGFNVHYYRQFHPTYRWQAGVLHHRWPGNYFNGGEFQVGAQFGAPGQFDDLVITGVFGGFTAIARRHSQWQPYASADLALVHIEELNVTVNGVSQPYWKSSFKDHLHLRAGVQYLASETVTIVVHLGFSILGTPDAVDIFSSATAGSAADVGIGVSFPL